MDAIQKLEADVRRAKKTARARGVPVLPLIEQSFLNLNRDAPSLAHAFYDFWYETYAAPSRDAPADIADSNLRKLLAIQALLEGAYDQSDDLSDGDLRSLCETAGYAADDVPLEKLNSLMAFFLERGAM